MIVFFWDNKISENIKKILEWHKLVPHCTYAYGHKNTVVYDVLFVMSCLIIK